jgi:sodium transport system ATP-binding protein
LIEARDIHKRFGGVVAVDGMSFVAEDGRVTGLLGPNGAGKTTVLRIIYGLIQPDRGGAHIDDVDVSRRPRDAQARIGVLPDARGLYPRLTAREHIAYFGALHGLTHKALETRTDELLELLDMREIADRRVQGFSQGERAKVAIARALVHRPRNVVLDEPTNGLDVMSTRAMRALIRQLREEGRCVVFSSHLMQEVAALCDHIVVVAAGRVVLEGDQERLLEKTGANTLEDAFVRAIGASPEELEA